MAGSLSYTVMLIGGFVGVFLAYDVTVYVSLLVASLILLLLHWGFATHAKYVPPPDAELRGPRTEVGDGFGEYQPGEGPVPRDAQGRLPPPSYDNMVNSLKQSSLSGS